MIPLLFLLLFFSFFGSVVLTQFVRKLSFSKNILDDPNERADKLQTKPIPLLGGVGFSVICTILTIIVWIAKNNNLELQNTLAQNLIYPFHILWIVVGLSVLLIGGIVDDIYTLKSKWILLYITVGISISVFLGGLKIETFSYPFDSLPIRIGLLPQILAFGWIMLCTAATKFLDGHDGLVVSVGVISLLNIASIGLLPTVNQPLIVVISLIWASGIGSFLWQNFPEAKMYLGESGSEIIGFVIGVLSILSGAKIATSSVVVGWFVFDILLVFIIRFLNKKPLFTADSSHWHHRLQKLGMSKIQILVITILIVLTSTHVGMNFGTGYKVISVAIQPIIIIVIFLVGLRNNKL